MGSEADTDAYGGELDGLFAQLGDGTLKPPKVQYGCCVCQMRRGVGRKRWRHSRVSALCMMAALFGR